MSETLPEALVRLARLVDELAVDIAIIGGVAIIARVRARATEDLDLLMAYQRDELDSLLESFERHGYEFDEADRELFEEGLIRMWGPPNREQGIGVDIIAADSAYLREVIRRATPVKLAAATLPCAQVEDLILMKLEANRGIDIDDVLAIKDAFEPQLDMSYLRSQAQQLALVEQLELYFGGPEVSTELDA